MSKHVEIIPTLIRMWYRTSSWLQ